MNWKRFQIGDWVVVAAVTEFNTLAGERKSTRTQFDWPKLGKITGIGKRYEGMLCEGGTDYETGETDPLEFQQSTQVMGWLVRFGMANKEQFVLDEDVTLSIGGDRLHIEGQSALRYQSGRRFWKKEHRDAMREEMKTALRDSKGRWLPFDVGRRVSEEKP